MLETDNGLVLVDTGFGLLDCADPRRIGPSRRVIRPRFDVATHFDVDHIGGIADFPAAMELDSIAPGIVLVSLPGHTRGHACVAVDAGHRWVLDCGDAFYYEGTLDGRSRVPWGLKVSEKLVAFDRKAMRDNHSRLAELYAHRDPKLLIVSARDPRLLANAIATDA